MRASMKVRITQVALVVAALVVYQILWSAGDLTNTTFAGLNQIVSTAKTDVITGSYWSSSLIPTLEEIVLAFLAATALGVVTGTVAWRYSSVYRVMHPYLALTYSIPFFIFYPAAIGLLGFGILPVIVIAALFGAPIITIHTVNGLRATSQTHVGVAQSFGLGHRETLRRVYAPSAWPEVFNGMRLGMAFVVVSVLATEFILSTRGVGHAISLSYENFAIPPMWASVLLAILLALILNGGLGLVLPARRGR